jgi:PAS domain S-box-containing protein
MSANSDSDFSTITQELRDLGRRTSDIMDLLRTQQRTLKKRSVGLPDNVMTDVRTLKKRLDALSRSIVDVKQELRSLRALAETTAVINSSQNTDEILRQVMDTAIALTGAERGYIVLKNPDSGDLEFRVARGMEQSKLDESKAMIISKTIVNDVAESGEPVLTDNASNDDRYQSEDSIIGFKLRSILAVPLTVQDEVIGVVYCDNRFMSGLFKQHELNVLTAFASQAAVALENARLFESARMRLREVTDIRDRMDNLFRSIASGVITVNDDDCVLISNAAAEEMLNQADMRGRQLRKILPEMSGEFWAALQQVRETGQQHTLECAPTVDNRQRYWSVIASPLRDDNGQQGVAMVIDDMTEEKQSETQLTEVRRYLPLALVQSMGDVDMTDVGSQERIITALFADVRGFTTFSETLEPEELMQVINKYLSLASDAVNLFEGIVDKYMGDAVTGLFNTQLNPQKDHPARAVQAALQLVLDLHAQHEVMSDDERLFYGIGIHTGEAVLGNVGGVSRKEFTALGEATDVCKYLQEQAGPGEIIISGKTYEQIKDDFECEALDEPRRPSPTYAHVKCYKVLRRKKGGRSMFVDDELLELLGEMDELDDLTDES